METRPANSTCEQIAVATVMATFVAVPVAIAKEIDVVSDVV